MPDPERPRPLPVGRGACSNPSGRFEAVRRLSGPAHEDPGAHRPEFDGERPRLDTQVFPDRSKSVLVRNESVDLPFSWSLNPYRGCEHACAYCFARPFHEYLGWSAGLDFESKLLAKFDAPTLLAQALRKPGWTGEGIALSTVTDAWQPVERRLQITRRCLEVLADARQPIGLITKNHLVTRDLDHLGELARHDAVQAALSITTLDPKLARALEPRASTPAMRLRAITQLSDAGIPVRVMVAPLIPGLTDPELPAILEAAAQAGATSAGYVLLRLPHGVKDLFAEWLEEHRPLRKERVLSRVRDVRAGALNDGRFGSRFRGEGAYAKHLQTLFRATAHRLGLRTGRDTDASPPPQARAFRRPEDLPLFQQGPRAHQKKDQ